MSMKCLLGRSSPRPFSPPGNSLINSGIGDASICQTPDRSGFLLARGTGAFRLGRPSLVVGVDLGVYCAHCASTATDITASKPARTAPRMCIVPPLVDASDTGKPRNRVLTLLGGEATNAGQAATRPGSEQGAPGEKQHGTQPL